MLQANCLILTATLETRNYFFFSHFTAKTGLEVGRKLADVTQLGREAAPVSA